MFHVPLLIVLLMHELTIAIVGTVSLEAIQILGGVSANIDIVLRKLSLTCGIVTAEGAKCIVLPDVVWIPAV